VDCERPETEATGRIRDVARYSLRQGKSGFQPGLDRLFPHFILVASRCRYAWRMPYPASLALRPSFRPESAKEPSSPLATTPSRQGGADKRHVEVPKRQDIDKCGGRWLLWCPNPGPEF